MNGCLEGTLNHLMGKLHSAQGRISNISLTMDAMTKASLKSEDGEKQKDAILYPCYCV